MEYDSEALIAAAQELIEVARQRASEVLEADPDATVASVLAAIDWNNLLDEVYEPAVRLAVEQVLASSADELETTVPTNAAFVTQIEQVIAAILFQAQNFSGKLRQYLEANIDIFRDDPNETNLTILLSSLIGDWFAEFQWENDRGGVELAPQIILARFRNVPVRKIWLTREDDRVRDFHEFAHLQSRDRDGAFLLGNGESARFPRDPELSDSNFFGCRCWMELEFDRTSGLTASGGNTLTEPLNTLKLSDMSRDTSAGVIMSDEQILEDFGIEVTETGSMLKGSDAKDWLEKNGFRFDIDIDGEIVISVIDGERSMYKVIETQLVAETEELSEEDCGCEDGVVSAVRDGVTITVDDFVVPDTSVFENTVFNQTTTNGITFTTFEHEGIEQYVPEWRGPIVFEGIETGDGRFIQDGALEFADLPLTLYAMLRQPDGGNGHAAAVIAGRIDNLYRVDGGAIMGEGVFESGPVGQEVRRLVEERVLRGISVDLDMVEVASSDSDDPMAALLGEDTISLTKGRIRAATLTGMAAFEPARIEVVMPDEALVASGDFVPTVRVTSQFTLVESDEDVQALIASGEMLGLDVVPHHPPAEWFSKPDMDKIRPLMVESDGRVWGVVAGAKSCHIGFPGKCVTPPANADMSFPHFHTGKVLCEDGTMVRSGILVQGTHPLNADGTPDLRMPVDSAKAHYSALDIVADVRLYWDSELGVIAAGAVRPSATLDQVRDLRSSNCSLDYRVVRTADRRLPKREVVGLVTVPVSGWQDADEALVASGGYTGWDVEKDEPLASVGAHMIRRELQPFTDTMDEVRVLRDELTEMREHLNILRSDRLRNLKKED